MRSVRIRGHVAHTHVATALILRQMLGTGHGANGPGTAPMVGSGGGGMGLALGTLGAAAPLM